MICGARRRYGRGICKAAPVAGKKRCRLHGGKPGAGNRTPKPWLAVARAQWVERNHAAGLKARTGFAVTPLRAVEAYPDAEQRRAVRMIDEVIGGLPAAPAKPLEEWSPAELLNDNARLSLMRLREIVSVPIGDVEDIKEKRLIMEAASTQVKVLANVQIAALQARQDRGMERLRKANEAFDASTTKG